MFRDFAAGNRQAIHPNIRGSVYSIVLQNGGDKEYESILNEYRTAKDADERNTALRSLGRAKGEKLVNRTLSLPLSEEVKGQDVYLPIAGMRSDAEGIRALWSWMTANWDELQKKCPPGLSMLGSIVQICTSGFTTEEQLKEVKEFYDGRSTKGFDRALEQSSDSIRAKASWLARDRGDVEGWLEAHEYLGKGAAGKL
jgi:aminopeptidase 2